MTVQNIAFNYNPFNITTAPEFWTEQSISLPARICKGTSAIAYDIYVKNPYELIIGNCTKLFTATATQPLRIKIAVCATAALAIPFTLMLYGASIHLAGISLQAIAGHTSITALPIIAEATKEFGKNLFIVGAVPFYGLFYALPKHIIQTLPAVLRAVTEKVAIAAKWTFQNVLDPLWTNVVVPVAKLTYQAMQFVASKIGVALEAISNAVALTAKWTFRNVLIPLWNHVLLPALRVAEKAVFFIATQLSEVVRFIGFKVANATQWIFQNVISPLWNTAAVLWNVAVLPALKYLGDKIIYLAKNLGHAISEIASAVAQAAQWTFSHVIAPSWNNLIIPVLKTAGNTIAFVAKAAGEAIQLLAQETAKAASFVFRTFILPAFKKVGHLIRTAGSFISNHVIGPLKSILEHLAGRVGSVFNAVLENALIPTLKSVVRVFNMLGNAAMSFKSEIVKTVAEVWTRMSLTFSVV